MSATSPLLSLIIPAYNEGERLPNTLPDVFDFLEAQPYSFEIIIVNNNSTDNTHQVAQALVAGRPYARVIDEMTQGKGAAVRTGMLAAGGEYLFMADADFSMPVAEIAKFLPPRSGRYDVAIGSREAAGAVRFNEPHYRHFMGRVFNFYVKVLAIPGFEDTQCGFKCFTREVALDILPNQTINGWAFDVELLFIALRRGYKIIEVPVHWYYGANSRVSPVRDTINMIREVLRIRWNGLQGRYSRRHTADPAITETR
ncbi:MAG: glycosyltransferase family 2 protein [Candidatus Promineofilum sp.]|nr:glycosyltransferase family 2 protein [Promineifilum sp.]